MLLKFRSGPPAACCPDNLARLHKRVGAPTAVAARRNGRAQMERAGGGPTTVCNAGYAHWSQGQGGESSTPCKNRASAATHLKQRCAV